MTALTAFALIPVIAGGFIVAGYAITAPNSSTTPAERFAVASLLGLAVIILNLSVLNFFFPIRGVVAWLSLWPIAVTLLRGRRRKALVGDIAAIKRHRHFPLAVALGLAFLALSFWPKLSQPDLVYFDGTSNHDGYFWVTGASQLGQHSYMEHSSIDSAHPWANLSEAIRGWKPKWGRAGTESLLAALAALVGVDPVGAYLPLAAALFIPWVGAVYLVVRTFYLSALSRTAVAALFVLQPLFLFFQANGNLPNLLGSLTGALGVVAVERSTRSHSGSRFWLIALAAAVNALLFCYPEIAPFIALSGGLLVARAWVAPATRPAAYSAAFAALAGLAINPATTIRAINGFLHSYRSAQLNYEWANIFGQLEAIQYLPSLATLSISAGHYFGPIAGLAATAILLAATIFTFSRARDRYGAVVSLSGGALLLAYTLAADFSYGLQKSAQFSAIFIAAVLPVAALHDTGNSPGRWWRRALAGGVAAIFATSVVFHFIEREKWSRRKVITTDWTALSSFARVSLRATPILVEPATFNMSFFNGMWAAYFLQQNPLTFAARGNQNGGYIRGTVTREVPSAPVVASPVLVSRAWAETFDANSPRLFTGARVVLLRSANRVMRLDGLLPLEGVPQTAAAHFTIEILPHARSSMQFELCPLAGQPAATSWQITARIAGTPALSTIIAGPAPWHINMPLTAGRVNHIELAASGPFSPDDSPSFAIAGLRVTSAP